MTEQEKVLVYRLAHKLTGAHPEGTYQIGIFLTNVTRRMRETGFRNLTDYLESALGSTEEHAQLLSALTIHTTSWFRENPHYVILQKILLARVSQQPYQMWSSATSTGEEVYSFALLFEEFRHFHPEFDYRILGTDIDPISLSTAKSAIYDQKYLTGPVSYYKKHVMLGSDNTQGLFTFSSDIRKRCQFQPHDIRTSLPTDTQFDLIVCRNVLIYFQAKQVQDVISHLLSHLLPGGHLILGHSEMIDHASYNLELRGHAVYEKSKTLRKAPPRVELPRTPEVLPVTIPLPEAPDEASDQIALQHMDAVVHVKVRPYEPLKIINSPAPDFRPKLILIGASTGGPQALAEALWALPTSTPPIVIAQHISSRFSATFAQRLAEVTGLKLGGVDDQEILLRGHIYCADLDHHIGIQKAGAYFLRINDSGKLWNGHRPSVDFLFRSARNVAEETIAILLSGMGRDGAKEMQNLHDLGSYTMVQSESDCVVFGMPKEAIALGGVDCVGTAEQIHDMIYQITQRQ